MGYQQSYIQYENIENLKSDLQEYAKRDTSGDYAEVICLARVKETVHSFKKDEVLVAVGGERGPQRNLSLLSSEVGLTRATDIHFIDDLLYEIGRDFSLNEQLHEKYFEQISDEETKRILA